MGKSPGRWIKTVLFGKKHSKSNLSKNDAPDKKASAKAPVEDPAGYSPVISDPYQLTDKGADNMELDKGTSATPRGTTASFPGNQGLDSQCNNVSVPVSDDEMRRQDEAATKAQSVFRGYLARRAFRALKGIIKLQALIRGHLVRRQAVATLRCMRAIVKLQAVARGRMDAKQVDIGANSIFGSEKLAASAYVRKLVLSLPTAIPLSLQYNTAEPNSAWNWLKRWSISRFWDPPSCPALNIKPQTKQGGPQIVKYEAGKSKRSNRKASNAANGDNGSLASSEIDKPKQSSRKAAVTSHQTELVQEQPQNELERVKRSLRKISASAAVASEKPEAESEKEMVISSEKIPSLDCLVDKLAFLEAPSKATSMDESIDVQYNDRELVETHSVEVDEKMECTPLSREELSSKEGENGKKIVKRRSLPAKQDYIENISMNTASLPSYMAATESAKAKLRAQESSRFSDDVAERGYVRRHSLPASNNGKMSSFSPRVQKPLQTNGKGSSKTNRSMMSSRDDKALLPGWRR